MPLGSGHCDHQGIVAEQRVAGTPWWKVGHGIGPAYANHTSFRRLPSVGAATHPVIGTREGNAACAVRSRERDGSLHRLPGIQIAHAAVAVPTLQWTTSGSQLQDRMDVHHALANPAHKSWKTPQPVRVNAVSARLREEPGAEVCAFMGEAEFFENLSQNFLNFLNWDSDHSTDILTHVLIVVMRYENFVSCHENFVFLSS